MVGFVLKIQELGAGSVISKSSLQKYLGLVVIRSLSRLSLHTVGKREGLDALPQYCPSPPLKRRGLRAWRTPGSEEDLPPLWLGSRPSFALG